MKWGVTMEYNESMKHMVKVLRLGPFIVDKRHEVNCYYIHKLNYHMLIDLPPIQKFDQLIDQLSDTIALDELTHIIVMNGSLSTIEVISRMMDEGFHGAIITNAYLARQMINANIGLKILKIDDPESISSVKDAELQFIPMYFLPYPDMFMVFEPFQKILFSNLFMSSYTTKRQPSLTDIKKDMFAFHKEMMPSSIFLKPVVMKVKTIHPLFVFPSYGSVIISENLPEILEMMVQMTFHNNYLSNSKVGFANEDMDYTLIINELLSKLKQHYSRIEILNTFIGSPFHLESESLMLKKSSLVNYKLWHSFFDYIYAKQGMSWLTIMEPTVNHLVSSYELEMPAIYRSETIKLRQEARDLEEKKIALESSLSSLNQQIEDAKDLILRDKLTMLYQQDVLYKMMTEHFSNHLAPAGKTRGLLLIQLDQLPDINRRFNKETGDETVRNMVYVIDQVKHEKTLLFKQRGPGIYALIENETLEYIINEALAFRNAVAQATSFIEKVTVSIAVVTCHEVDGNLPIDERLNNLMNLIEKRMAYAKVKGQNLIIDERTELPEHIEGSLLLVDQDEINRNMLYRIFKRAHYEIVLADSVVEALSILQKRKIDIVISEINLSKMDGFQLKMKMNESKSFQDIPFIMVSHNKTIENIKRGNLLGVDLILEKPIVPEELIGHVNRMKERVRS
jgi:diguanylate cyclase (GGDEF)-like protein